MKQWGPLAILAAAQFLMVLDQAVMNVSISQLVEDFDTTVTTIQGIITLYSLVMAMFMVTGGKIGDRIGRKKAFVIGLVIYGCGSALTAVSQTVVVLALGWSILEGIGAALVLPALAALIAGNYEGRLRGVAYAVIGGVAGAGIAVGPILGGWATTELSWRVVFAGEVAIVAAILLFRHLLSDAPRPGEPPQIDVLGAVLSAAGLGLIVLGVLQASSWGWIRPKDSPVEPFGFSLSVFMVLGGAGLLILFAHWQRAREDAGRDPLVHLSMFRIATLRSSLQTFLAQNLILMGIFFAIPLYLQLVLGLDALETGIKMLPVSIAMLVTSMAGSWLATRYAARGIVRAGLSVLLVSVLGLLATMEPELNSVPFAVAMACLGVGMGLIASQLGNIIQSSVDAGGRGEAGGLQYTAQQLGSALGVALIGAIVLSVLTATFTQNVSDDDRIDDEINQQVSVAVDGDVSFVASEEVEQAAIDAGYDDATVDALVENYEDSQLFALKAGLLATGAIVLIAFAFTGNLPSTKPERDGPEGAGPMDGTLAIA